MSIKGTEVIASGSKQEASETTPLVNKTDLEHEDEYRDGIGNSGLSVKQIVRLMAGELAGGVVALPRALVRTGWVGVPLIVLLCVISAFSRKRLGDCWAIIHHREPQVPRNVNQYAVIANRTLGKNWSVVVSVALIVTLFGASVVYLLLAAQIIEQVFLAVMPSGTLCIWFLIVVGAMTPLLLFGSPKDSVFTGAIACGSMLLACILYSIQILDDIRPIVFRWGIHGFKDFFISFGTIMFSFGGVSAFSTIQHDCFKNNKFNSIPQWGFFAILALYLPIAIGGYAAYGENAAPNVTTNLSTTPLTLVANMLMAIYLVIGCLSMMNPVCHELEELYNVPRGAVGRRSFVRLTIMFAILFLGESIPRFYTILALIGGTSVALLTFVLPAYCYLTLTNQTPRDGQEQIISPGWMRLVCWEVVTVGVLGGIAVTISAISAIFSSSQASPCYFR